MKQRRNELVAIECRLADDTGMDPAHLTTRPIILAGGPHAEANRLAMIENMTRMVGGEWSARIVYHWRSKAHLSRWLARGGRWRKSRTRL